MNSIPNYNLIDNNSTKESKGYFHNLRESAGEFGQYVGSDKKNVFYAFICVVFNSLATVATPYFISRAIDTYIQNKNIAGLSKIIFILLGLYILNIVTNYLQTRIMGAVTQRTLFRLRAGIFSKLQSLPIAFFNQNKAGDLMSRINNDTDKLSEFLSEGVIRFLGGFFGLIGIAIAILLLNFKLAIILLSSTLLLLIITQIISPIVQKKNAASLKTLGLLSSNVQENVTNFKVIVAFNRRNYFESSINEQNRQNFKTSVVAGYFNNIFSALYDFAGNIAQLFVLTYGIYLIINGQLTIGLLIGFLGYAQRFYEPLRTIASIFSNIQISLAAWSRIRDILGLKNSMTTMSETKPILKGANVLSFNHVYFQYDADTKVLNDIHIQLEAGKTYALVGPTGGGKSTTASLMARLYDPTEGEILFAGRDIRSYSHEETGKRIGVILQEPFLFTGTVSENIRYGNPELESKSDIELKELLRQQDLLSLLDRFEKGLETTVDDSSENISLGQKQLISFIRIILREPDLLILDEATANIDTVTEELLNTIIAKLPSSTTKVIIAHRLNTIREADQIIFINGGKAEIAGSYTHALDMINSSRRQS